MDKRHYLARLRDSLAGLPAAEIEEIVRDYEEHFRSGAENGRSDAEIAVSLGMPEEIARQYRGAAPADPVGPIDRTRMWGAGAILIALNVTILFTPLFSLFWIWLAAWVVTWVATAVGVLAFVIGLLALPVPFFDLFAGPFLIFFGAGAILFGIAASMLLSLFTKLAVTVIRWWVDLNVGIARRAGGAYA